MFLLLLFFISSNANKRLELQPLQGNELALNEVRIKTGNYCVRIKTGNGQDNDGYLKVTVDIGYGLKPWFSSSLWKDEEVIKCWYQPVVNVGLINPKTDGWRGEIQYSTDGSLSYSTMECIRGCTGVPPLWVDGDGSYGCHGDIVCVLQEVGVCRDSHANCSAMVRDGYCEAEPEYYKSLCHASCNICATVAPVGGATATPPPELPEEPATELPEEPATEFYQKSDGY